MASQRCENSRSRLPESFLSCAPSMPRSEQCFAQGLSLAAAAAQNKTVRQHRTTPVW